MTAYYNENDPFAAAWLRNLIAMGLIAPGDVDERSITDVRATDLVGYRQVHFFAGIGGWSLAIRLAGIPDDAPVWTGSCPCQPFSVAGRGKGTDDVRHLWPVMRDLVAECLPPVVLGEQVASAPGRLWLAAVRADLEDLGYAVGAADLCAAGIGAPHIRQRLYWGGRLANAGRERFRGEGPGASAGAPGCVRGEAWEQRLRADARPGGAAHVLGLADADRSGSGPRGAAHDDGARPNADGHGGLGHPGVERLDGLHPLLRPEAPGRDPAPLPETAGRGGADRVGDSRCPGLPPREREAVVGAGRWGEGGATSESGEAPAGPGWPSEAHGGWTAPDWLRCRDERWRPVEPSHEQVVDGLPAGVVRSSGGDLLAAWSSLSPEDRKAVRRFRRGLDRDGEQFMRVLFSPLERAAINRAGRLRGYGNAIVPQLAAEFTLAFFGDEPWAPTRLQG